MLLKDFLGQVLGPDFFRSLRFSKLPQPLKWALSSDACVKRWSQSIPHREAICSFLLSSFIVTGNFLFPSACSVWKGGSPVTYFCVTNHLSSFWLKTAFIWLTNLEFGQSSATIFSRSSTRQWYRQMQCWRWKSFFFLIISFLYFCLCRVFVASWVFL